jgi:hypothetical protein
MDLDAIEQRANAATQGPWTLERVGDWHEPGWMIDGIVRGPKGDNTLNVDGDKALGEFIAHARTDVPALVARVRELEEERDQIKVYLDHARDIACDHCSGSRVDPDNTYPPEEGDEAVLVPCPVCTKEEK